MGKRKTKGKSEGTYKGDEEMNKDGILMAISLKNQSLRIGDDWYYCGAELWEKVSKTPKNTDVIYDYIEVGTKRVLSWFETKKINVPLTEFKITQNSKHTKDEEITMLAILKVAPEILSWEITLGGRKEIPNKEFAIERTKEIAKDLFKFVKTGTY